MHKLLAIQLRKFFDAKSKEELVGQHPNMGFFLDAVNQAYQQFDRDLWLAHRSLNISSEELHQVCTRQQEVLDALRNTAKLLVPHTSGTWQQGFESSDAQALVAFMHQLIQERQEAETILAEREAHHRAVLESVQEVLFQLDSHGRVRFVNAAWTELNGWPIKETLGRPFLDFIPSSDHTSWNQTLQKALSGSYNLLPQERRFMQKDGGLRWMRVHTRPMRSGAPGVSGTLVDINDQKRQEAAMLQTQKLESLGVLAGGIAHDFNNLLVSIMGNADLAMRYIADTQKSRQHLGQVLTAVDRAAELCRQLLAYSGKGCFQTEAINLNGLVCEISHLLQVSIGKNVELIFDLADNLPAILGDPSQIRQAVMNLVINAAEAIASHAEYPEVAEGENVNPLPCIGHVRISTRLRRESLNGDYRACLANPIHENGEVCLFVEDNGCGMDEETQKRIFDPFFTTKFTGRGLGLAAILGIVGSHRGSLHLRTQQDQGTTFCLGFPATQLPPLLDQIAEEGNPMQEEGIVLLADDEQSVRALLSDALTVMGFTVMEAINGREALARFTEHQDEIRAVILDLTMPLMGGEEVFCHIQQMRPGLPCVLMSGYSEQEVKAIGQNNPCVTFLQKPFKLTELSRVLKKTLAVKTNIN